MKRPPALALSSEADTDEATATEGSAKRARIALPTPSAEALDAAFAARLGDRAALRVDVDQVAAAADATEEPEVARLETPGPAALEAALALRARRPADVGIPKGGAAGEPPPSPARLLTPAPADVEAALGGAAEASARLAAAEAAGDTGGTLLVLGLPKKWNDGAFARFLHKLGLTHVSCKKGSGVTGTVCFAFPRERAAAEAALVRQVFFGRNLSVKDAGARKNGKKGVDGGTAYKEIAAGGSRDVRDAVAPLWRLSYPEQLQKKQEFVLGALRNMVKKAKKAIVPTPTWADAGARSRGGIAAPFFGILRSPLIDGYRNKAEFSVGPGAGGAPAVGFNVGNFRDGHASVGEADQCPNISPASKALALAMQTYLRTTTELPVWDKRKNAGFWRLLVVREGGMAPPSGGWEPWLCPPVLGEKGDVVGVGSPPADAAGNPAAEAVAGAVPRDDAEVMAVVQVNPTGVPPEKVRAECAAMDAALRAAAAASSPPFALTSTLAQFYEGISNRAPDDCPVTPLAGAAAADAKAEVLHIHERMNGLRFRVSPTSFFQVNTAAAEALYELAGEWAGAGGEETLLFDVCSGTGTIGLTMAAKVAQVVGVELVQAAVDDSVVNAELNGVANARFVCGKAEAVMPGELKKHAKDAEAGAGGCPTRVVAIVDPPRAGLHGKVLSALRSCAALTRLVYVSCNPESCADDVVELCKPGGYKRAPPPFEPVRAAAVDLFPHANHCESVVLLERAAPAAAPEA